MDAQSPTSGPGSTSPASPYEGVRSAPPPVSQAASFAAIFERHMATARSEIEGVRAEIASLRDGGARPRDIATPLDWLEGDVNGRCGHAAEGDVDR